MPRKQFQHQKKQERERRAQRLSSQVSNSMFSLLCTSLIQLQSESPLHQLHTMLSLPSRYWSDQTQDRDEKIMLCRMSEQLKVTHSLSDLSWSLFVNQRRQLLVVHLEHLLEHVSTVADSSAGQPDDRMILTKKSKITSSNGEVVAYVRETYTRTFNTLSFCQMLILY